jgi:hypothetical protein
MPTATNDEFDLDIRLQRLSPDAQAEKYPPPTVELNCTTTTRHCTSEYC